MFHWSTSCISSWWQSTSSLMLKVEHILLTHLMRFLAIIFTKRMHKTVHNKQTWHVTFHIYWYLHRYSYRFSHISFSIEVKEGSKQNEVSLSWIFIPPMRVIHRENLLKPFLSLSLSHFCHPRADLTLSSHTLWHKKRHTCTQILSSHHLTRNPNQGHLTGKTGGQHLTN
jgi:hypothetical protein